MHIGLWKIFIAFCKVGIFAFGGGQSIIPIMEKEVVQTQQWMKVPEFTDLLALGNGLPGPIATKMAVAVGYKMSGWLGSFVALGGLLFPSTVMMMIVILFFMTYKDSPRLQSFLRGVRPAVMALLLAVAYDVGRSSVDSIPTALLGIATLALIIFVKLHPALGLLLSGFIGLIFL